jgi:hypothetical protein
MWDENEGQLDMADSGMRIEVAEANSHTGCKGEIEQNSAIDKAVSILYLYSPRKGQRDALRHLIYRRKDLILTIAKTSFGKSMTLQAVSILMQKSITLVILSLDQIGKIKWNTSPTLEESLVSTP